jgi:hypothetical protein
MNRKRLITLTVLITLLLGVSGTMAEAPQPAGEVSIEATVNSRINFQGLLQEDGNPVTGSRDMTFRFYSDSGCTSQVGGDIAMPGVPVSDGLFSVALDVTHDDFDGQGLWLEVEVGGTAIVCQEITPVPYALSLRPGADIVGELAGSNTLTVENSSTANDSRAIRGYASAATGFTAGVNGRTDSSSTGAKGVWGYAAGGGQTYGVHGESNSTSGRGVYGRANTSSGTNFGVYGETASTSGRGVYGEATSHSGTTYGVYGLSEADEGRAVYGWASSQTGENYGVYGRSDSADGRGVYGYALGFSGTNYGVYGETNSTDGRGVYGWANASSGTTFGVYGETGSTSGRGVYGIATAASGQTYGVYGRTESSSFGARGVYGHAAAYSGQTYGVYGRTDSNGSGAKGVYGYAGDYSGTTYGVYGQSNSPDGYGLYGNNSTGGYAGYFLGDVGVTGTLSKGGGSFKIDHPLDPENRYLSHSFVESPDMMNVYNGNVVLDKNGQAWVELPDYFGALNRDFRYQLTCIGGFAPVYVALEIQDNHFQIAGGEPGLMVSWQVTGIRQDPWARANRIPVEEEKQADEQGYYLHPEVYGQPMSKGIHGTPDLE